MGETGERRAPASREPVIDLDIDEEDPLAQVLELERAARMNGRVNGDAAPRTQAPCVIWLTGLSGAGKSTIAQELHRELAALEVDAYVLDGDALRTGLNADLGFSPSDRRENVRRVAEVAHLMYDAGLVVIAALISPFAEDRAAARALFPAGDFIEVHVDTALEVCVQRDTKGLYAKAASGVLATMTGRGQRYEPPVSPEVVVHGVGDVHEEVGRLVRAVLAVPARGR